MRSNLEAQETEDTHRDNGPRILFPLILREQENSCPRIWSERVREPAFRMGGLPEASLPGNTLYVTNSGSWSPTATRGQH